jgi:serine/threonine protein phosphatase PrpC
VDNINSEGLSQKPIRIETGKRSHKGMVRSSNEDSLMSLEFYIEEGSETKYCGLFAVADGVGGREGGEVASSLSLQTLTASLLESLLLPSLKEEIDQINQEFISSVLIEGIKEANKEIYSQNQSNNSDMGTTLAVVLIIDSTTYIANVGDSRVYLLEGEKLTQVTTDHSLVASLVAAGQISQEEIYTHPRRNIITRCLGMQQDVEVDLFTEELKPGKSLILCSDGLWEMVRDNEIKDIVLKADNLHISCEQLIEMANQNGGLDNISVVIVQVTS